MYVPRTSLALTRFELVRRAYCTEMGVTSTVTTQFGSVAELLIGVIGTNVLNSLLREVSDRKDEGHKDTISFFGPM